MFAASEEKKREREKNKLILVCLFFALSLLFSGNKGAVPKDHCEVHGQVSKRMYVRR